MAVLYVYREPANGDVFYGVPNRDITDTEWADFTLTQKRIVKEALSDGDNVWVHIDQATETEAERIAREAEEAASRQAAIQAARYIRGRDFDPVVANLTPAAGEVVRGTASGVESVPFDAAVRAAVLAGPATLPNIAGLLFRLDAQALSATDQTRLAAWTDVVTGTKQAVQATAGQQPLYVRDGINGRPAVRFETARNDILVASSVGMTSNYATVFVVATKPEIGGNTYLLGTSGHAKNLYTTTSAGNQAVGIQSVSTYTTPAVVDTPQIVTGVFNDAASKTRIDSVETTGTVGTATILPATLSIGNRPSATAGQGFNGLIGEVLYYDRALTSGECHAIELYLSAKWGIPITAQTDWYVDSVHGNNANTGRSADAPLLTLTRARYGIAAAKAVDATIHITAPEDAPLRPSQSFAVATGNTVRLKSAVPGEKFHIAGSQRITSGWTALAGGVYSRAVTIATDIAPFAFVPTLLDAFGQPTRVFSRNTATPTTPAAGEYGYTGGTYYLHLPGNANPNQHAVEIASLTDIVVAHTNSLVVIEDGVIYGAQSRPVLAGSASAAGGRIEATDSVAEYGTSGGWVTITDNKGMKLTRCIGRYTNNDGFNHTGNAGNISIMELIDCEGCWNSDEGVSPHGDERLVLRGGRYHHNGNGGLTAVGNSLVQLSDTEFDHNGLTNPAEYGVNIDETSRLISTNLYTHDNVAGGIRKAAGATWTDNGGTRSGTANGNGAPDAV